jgi:tetratricopeptide (TPR) repeat protein
MRNILAAFLTILMLLPVSAMGEIITIKQTVRQTFGGGQSADDARISGMAKAKREALEKAGTYIESLTIVKNSQVEKDEILALTAGVLKADVISQKNYASDDAFGIEIVVNVVVDTSVLEERVKKLLQDRTHLTQLKDTQKREKELLQKVAQLEDENRKLSANKQSTQQLKKEFQQASQGLTAVDWFKKAFALWDGEKITDLNKAVKYLSNAIKMQPDYAWAYNLRGNAYSDLGQKQSAIEDFNEAIRLQPNDCLFYIGRGSAYSDLGQYQRAIENLNEIIRLQPNDCLFLAYNLRGLAYGKLDQHQLAIEDYNEAIRMKPNDASIYIGRGTAYYSLGQYQRTIEDSNRVIRLQQPNLALGYYLRGNAYSELGQYQRAIEDFNEFIRLQPNNAKAYENRGFNYFIQGNNNLGCSDAQKACKLGDCKLSEAAKGKGFCR